MHERRSKKSIDFLSDASKDHQSFEDRLYSLLNDSSTAPQLREILLSTDSKEEGALTLLEAKMRSLNEKSMKSDMTELLHKLQGSASSQHSKSRRYPGNKAALREALHSLGGDATKTEIRVNALFAENQLRRLFRKLDAKRAYYHANDIADMFGPKFLAAKDIENTQAIIDECFEWVKKDQQQAHKNYQTVANIVKAAAKEQEEKKDEYVEPIEREHHLIVNDFLKELKKYGSDQSLPEFVKQADVIAWLNKEMMVYVKNDTSQDVKKTIMTRILGILENPFVCERLLFGQNEHERIEGQKIAVSIFTHFYFIPPNVNGISPQPALACMPLLQAQDNKKGWHGSGLFKAPAEIDMTNIKGVVLKFLQRNNAQADLHQAKAEDATVIAAKQMYTQVRSILEQRWNYIEKLFDLPPEMRPRSELEAVGKDSFLSLFKLVAFGFNSSLEFGNQASLFKFINCYPDIAINLFEMSWLKRLFVGDKEEGKQLVVHMLMDVHHRLERSSDQENERGGSNPNNHLGALPQDLRQLLLARLVRAMLENNVFEELSEVHQKIVLKSLYFLSIQSIASTHNKPNQFFHAAKAILDKYGNLLEQHYVRDVLKNVDLSKRITGQESKIDNQSVMNLIASINVATNLDFLSTLKRERLFTLLSMANRIWNETSRQQAFQVVFHEGEALGLNLSKRYLTSCELQLSLVQQLQKHPDLSVAEITEIHKTILITDFQRRAGHISLSEEQNRIFEAERLKCSGFVTAIDADLKEILAQQIHHDKEAILLDEREAATQAAQLLANVQQCWEEATLNDHPIAHDHDEAADHFKYDFEVEPDSPELKREVESESESESESEVRSEAKFELASELEFEEEAKPLESKFKSDFHPVPLKNAVWDQKSLRFLIDALDKSARTFVINTQQQRIVNEERALKIKSDAAKLRAQEIQQAELALEQERRAKEMQQEADKQQAQLDADVTAASVFRRYFVSLADKVQYSQAVRDQISVSPLIDTFFATHHQAAHAQLHTQQTEVFVPAGVMRKVFPLEKMEKSINVHETLRNPVIAAENRSQTLKRGEGAINYVKDDSIPKGTKSSAFTEKMTEKLGCYTEKVTAQDQYQIAIHQLPAIIQDLYQAALRQTFAAIVGNAKDERQKAALEDMFKQYKEPTPTVNGLYNFLRQQEMLSNMKDAQLREESVNLVNVVQQRMMNKIEASPGFSPGFIPNGHYLKFVNAQIESFVSAVGVNGKMYIYDYPGDPLITKSFILLCKVRNIPYENKSTLSYEPGQTEIKGAQEWLRRGSDNKVEKELQELQALKDKVGNGSDHIDKLERLIKQVGAGVSLSQQEEEDVLSIIRETEKHPNFKASGG